MFSVQTSQMARVSEDLRVKEHETLTTRGNEAKEGVHTIDRLEERARYRFAALPFPKMP